MYILDAVTSTTIGDVLELLGAVFTYLISKIGDVVTVIMSQPLLLIPIGVVLASTILAFFRRLF